MEKITCLIIDDEPIAREIVQSYCSHLPYLQVVALCSNALDAKKIIENQKIDLLFLDINMPVLDGMAFLKTLKIQPQVIFTTAYKEYALDAFELSASDYLLKPFSLERFIVAVDKALERMPKPITEIIEPNNTTIQDYIFIKTEGKIFKIFFSDLLFAEAQGNNTKIVTNQTTLLPSMTFSSFEEQLPQSIFMRVHRSFLINKSKITHIEGNRIFIENAEIPIGSNYKEVFMKELGM
jgi:DNA-binding LytR/AlgR family response regulator